MGYVNCPYCEAKQEIDHSDGEGVEEDTLHEKECGDCLKNFAYSTVIILEHEAYKAACLNGGDHNWVKSNIYPRNWPDARECTLCGTSEHGVYALSI